MNRPLRLVLVALALTTLVTACGRRGPLDPPLTAEQKAQQEAQQAGQRSGGQQAGQPRQQDGSVGLKSRRQPIVPPKRDLFIDRLLD